MTPAEIDVYALAKVARLVTFLNETARLRREYPTYSVGRLLATSVERGEVAPIDAVAVASALADALVSQEEDGRLLLVRDGYRLPALPSRPPPVGRAKRAKSRFARGEVV